MKPILFNTDMVRAILEDRKTVTRRVVKPQPEERYVHGENGCYIYRGIPCGLDGMTSLAPYRPGSILYVRETWAPFYETMYSAPVIGYRYYSETDEEIKERLPEYLNWFWPGRWSPSVHMPREAARIFLRVTDVRVERLQDITNEQAICEGIEPHEFLTNNAGSYVEYRIPGTHDLCPEACGAFTHLWNSTIKPKDRALYGWEANPWVWVIDFERCEKPGGD